MDFLKACYSMKIYIRVDFDKLPHRNDYLHIMLMKFSCHYSALHVLHVVISFNMTLLRTVQRCVFGKRKMRHQLILYLVQNVVS